MDLWGPDFSDSRDPIFTDSRHPMIIFSDARDPIFNSRDPHRVPKTPLTKPANSSQSAISDRCNTSSSKSDRYDT